MGVRASPLSGGAATPLVRRYGVSVSLGAKLRLPTPRRATLPRPRLANPFLGGSRPRLVLLSAAPGWGKTTLLRHWLGELRQADDTQDRSARVAWVSLDDSDADPVQFTSDLIASVQAVDADVAAHANALLREGRGSAEDLLAALLESLDEAPGLTVIALDDLHLVSGGPGAADALAFLVDNLPPQVVVAATSRADPALSLPRFRARGELVEIRDAELRFSDAEAAAFFRTVLGLALRPAQVEALVAKTEGWVAGLQLAGVSALAHLSAGPEDVDDFIQAFNGTHRFVLDYLVEEVLDVQPPEVRSFLMRTSVLDRLSGPVCDAVSGNTGGQRQLEALERANVFLTADVEPGYYRFHPLFAEALRNRLALEQPEVIGRLHHTASAWYASQGLLEDALRHAALTDDQGLLADLLECAAPALRRERRDRRLIGWIDTLTDAEVGKRPLLATIRAAANISQGDLASSADWLDAAEAALADLDASCPVPQVPAAVAAARSGALRTVPAEIQLFRASLAQASGDRAATVAHAEAALGAAAPGDHFVRGAAAGFLGLAHWATGSMAIAIDVFGGAVAELSAAGNDTDAAGATVVLGAMAMADGRPAEAERLYRAALTRARSTPSAAVVGDLHVGLADVLREADRLDAAASQLEQAADLGDGASLPENRFRWFTVRAALLVADSQFEAALRDIDEAERLHRPGFFPETRPLHAARARVLIRSGRLAEAQLWAEQHAVARADPEDFLREDEQLTYARLVATNRRAGQASDREVRTVLSSIDGTIAAAERAGRGGSLIEARTVQALLQHSAGMPTQATESLGIAVGSGVPAGYARLFLDEGAPIHDLLGRLASSGSADLAAAARRLRQAKPATTSLAIPTRHGGALSERESEVLRMLATDLSGPEIAAHLFVSINTLRTHTKHIFAKLEVRTRRAAVSRARASGLV